MDSLDAQCLITQLTGREMPAPDLWRHDRDGSLSCAYSGGEQTFTWRADDVAAMAERWRGSDRSEAPEEIGCFVDAHRRLGALLTESGLEPPDTVTHDLERGELRVVWEDRKVVVVIDELGEGVRAEA